MKTVKALLYYLGISNGVTGIWALFFPKQFYTSFPGFGFHWIDIMGPFSDHLTRDVGAFFCAIGSMAIFAVIRPAINKIRLACYSNLVFAVPHLIYHCYMIHMFPTAADKFWGILALALGAIAPVIILLKLNVTKSI
ncbi:hypothetical protein F0L74_12800 [Chitinophaga agrisoli]|uniref:DoxX-like protein n=1 Tax=Chitinophaga agrisoli TaxID=2607653 RepID=A0A5B2VX64_9BACT|nr:hypothetical protein [Chitinophaga agrisoli]KAA2243374.1 hypothetical protein F0L74_12800 [Chitinophaga agrisoli]